RCAGEFGESPPQKSREGEVDLLTDDRPKQSIEDRWFLHDAQPLAAFHEPRKPEFSGEPYKSARVLIEPEHATDDGMDDYRRGTLRSLERHLDGVDVDKKLKFDGRTVRETY